MYKSYFLVVFLFSALIKGYCQTYDPKNSLYRNQIGPSPTPAGLGRYGEVPVSLYTGVPEISIPIYTIENKDIVIPISLSYHAGGIKVDEESSIVGLGWSLNANGVINRSVRDRDDFEPTQGYLHNSIPEVFNERLNAELKSGVNVIRANVPSCTYEVPFGEVSASFLPDFPDDRSKRYDTEPDSYSYRFLGYSGKFIIKKDKEIIKEKPDGVVIKLINPNGSAFLIITPDGNKYSFDVQERVSFQTGSLDDATYTTTWFLSKIETPTGATVRFNYHEEPSAFATNVSQLSQYVVLAAIPLTGDPSQGYCSPPNGIQSSYPPSKYYKQVVLDGILFPNGSIGLQYDSRIDLANSKRLTKIFINNTLSPDLNQTYVLNQDYFTANFTSSGISGINPDRNLTSKRLRLKGLQQQDGRGNINKRYSFDYNENALPEKNSYARDHWGYFNGKGNNTTLIPKLSYKNPINYKYEQFTNGAKREPDPSFAQCYILKSITYPTGGKTHFEFESNEYDLSKSNIPIELTFHEQQDGLAFRRSDTANVSQTCEIEIFSPSSEVNIDLRSHGGYPDPSALPPSYESAYLEIYSVKESKKVYGMPLGKEEQWISMRFGNYSFYDKVNLPTGKYTVKLRVNKEAKFLNGLHLQLIWFDQNQSSDPIRIGPGLRVKKIIDEDGLGGKIVKNYQYRYQAPATDGSVQAYSHGKCLQMLRYLGNLVVPGCRSSQTGSTEQGISCRQFVLYSDSYSQGSGTILGYSQVNELRGETGRDGKTEYEFENEVDDRLNYGFYIDPRNVWSTFSIRPSGISDIAYLGNGLLKRKTDFKWDTQTGSYLKAREDMNQYFSDFSARALLGIRKITMIQRSYCNLYTACNWELGMYPAFQTQWLRIGTQISKEYNYQDGGVSLLQSETKYRYEENPVHYQPIEITTTRSDGKKIHTYTSYPSDYAPGTTFTDNLQSNNIHVPIEKVDVLSDGSQTSVLGGSLSVFSSTGNGLLDKIYALEAPTPISLSSFKFSNRIKGKLPVEDGPAGFDQDNLYKEKVAYSRYDNSGNPLQLVKTNDVPTTYLWGYHSTYPIAEIKNATYAEVVAVLGQAVIDELAGASPGTDAQVRQKLAPLRTDARLQKAQVSILTYRPLVGMTSATDAAGKTTYYEYDDFQRLKQVKDQEGSIVRQHIYHYKGQP